MIAFKLCALRLIRINIFLLVAQVLWVVPERATQGADIRQAINQANMICLCNAAFVEQ